MHINIVVGDLNCPGINWDDNTSSKDYINHALLHFAINEGFRQLVHLPTRGKKYIRPSFH